MQESDNDKTNFIDIDLTNNFMLKTLGSALQTKIKTMEGVTNVFLPYDGVISDSHRRYEIHGKNTVIYMHVMNEDSTFKISLIYDIPRKGSKELFKEVKEPLKDYIKSVSIQGGYRKRFKQSSRKRTHRKRSHKQSHRKIKSRRSRK